MAGGTIALDDLAAPQEAKSRASVRGARFVEFMLVGGLTLVLFPLAWLARRAFGLDDAEYAFGFLTFYAAYVINDPHFTVTYFLFYKDVRTRALGSAQPLAQRLRYVVAGFVVPVVLTAWAGGALLSRSAEALGWMVQLMFLLVGWHYVKQGFGVLTVLSARRGVRMTTFERRAMLFHGYAGWAYAWANPAMPSGKFEEKGVVYTQLAHPRWFELACGAVFLLSVVVMMAALVVGWRRQRRMLPLVPLSGFLITVWAWTIWSSIDPLVRYVIPALHSIQYFYFVWLLKRNHARAHEGPPSFGRPPSAVLGLLAAGALALGFVLFHAAPGLLDGALVARPKRGATWDALGPTPYFAAFYVFVNVHHYFMDFVIWRRDSPDVRYLALTR